MGLLGDFARGLQTGFRAAVGPGPDVNDDRFWSQSSPMVMSSTGITVTPALAFQVSAFYAGIRLKASSIAALPLRFIEQSVSEKGSKQKKRVGEYWLEDVIDARSGYANPWQMGMA